MAKKNTKAANTAATTDQVSMFAKSLSSKKETKKESSLTIVNEYSLTKAEAKSIKDIRIVRVNRTKSGDVLKARVTMQDGDQYDYELLHHWEFAAGDELDKSSITLCNLKGPEGLKKYNGEPVVYLYGDVE